MRAPLGSRGALLGDLGVSLGAALGGQMRRPLNREVWPLETAPWMAFRRGVQGGVYDWALGQYGSLFQDSAFTTPVTALEQPVGGLRDSGARGNHLIQPTTTKRMTLSARYNLLVKTDAFDDAAWTKSNVTVTANAGTAPDGTLTADKIIETAINGTHAILQSASIPGGAATKRRVRLKAGERTWAYVRQYDGTTNVGAWFDLANGVTGTVEAGVTAEITSLGDGWYLCSVAFTAAAGATSERCQIQPAAANGNASYLGDGTSGIYIWGADLRLTADATLPYQRVNTASDYDANGFPVYLKPDGADDFLYSASTIDFTGADKMTVVAGVGKLSDAASACFLETSATSALNNGSFAIFAPDSAGQARYFGRGRGTAANDFTTPGSYAAPHSAVLALSLNIAADRAVMRVNGSQAAVGTSDMGSGNFGNHALYLGARSGTGNFFGGRIYPFALIGADVGPNNLRKLEYWAALRMKGLVTLP